MKDSHRPPAVNQRMHESGMARFESILMPANFSSIVGEFMGAGIPKQCATIVKNQYHNGHPDMVPVGLFPGDAVQHAQEGIEIKGSRYLKGWQGHSSTQATGSSPDARRPAVARSPLP